MAKQLTEQIEHLRIQPSQGWVSLRLGHVWEYRELLYFLVWRDVKVRYKQTVLGGAWAIIQPLFTMVIFSIFFGKLAGIPSDGLPYPVFSYAALVPWTFFAQSLTHSSESLVNSSNLIKKVFFPRLVIPLGTVLSSLVDFFLAFLVLLGIMAHYRLVPNSHIVFLPVFLLLAFITALGVGLWLSALNVKFRDVKYVVPFLTQFWFYGTPVVWASSMVPEHWRPLLALNPMVGVVEGFRWALLGTDIDAGPMFVISWITAIVVMVSGAYNFRRMEREFADVV